MTEQRSAPMSASSDMPNVHHFGRVRPDEFDVPFWSFALLRATDAEGQEHIFYVPTEALATLDAARERPSALDVETLDALGALGYAIESLPKPGAKMTQAAYERITKALAAVDARLTEPDAGEGTEPWGDMTPAQRYAAWHDPDVCRRDAHGCMCSCHEGFTPGTTEATLRADAEAADPVGDLAAKLVPMFSDGLVDVPGERRIEDKAFALAHALRVAVQPEGGPE